MKRLNVAYLEDFVTIICNDPSLDLEIKPLKNNLYGETGLLINPYLIFVYKEGREYAVGFRDENLATAYYTFLTKESAQEFLDALLRLREITIKIFKIMKDN